MNHTESERVDFAWKEYDSTLSESNSIMTGDVTKSVGRVSEIF